MTKISTELKSSYDSRYVVFVGVSVWKSQCMIEKVGEAGVMLFLSRQTLTLYVEKASGPEQWPLTPKIGRVTWAFLKCYMTCDIGLRDMPHRG